MASVFLLAGYRVGLFGIGRLMAYLRVKAALAGVLVLAASEIARRNPGIGGFTSPSILALMRL